MVSEFACVNFKKVSLFNEFDVLRSAPIAHMFSDITEAQQAAVWQH